MGREKHRISTTGDFTRSQGVPARKRLRTLVAEDGGGEEATWSPSESDDDKSEDDTEGEEKGEAGLEDEEDIDFEDEALGTPQPERFNFSRIATKPRKQLAASITSTNSPSTFLSLGVSLPLQTALSSMSIRTPTEVQAACIPPLLHGKFSFNFENERVFNACLYIRQRLHRKCQDRVRKDRRVCNPYSPEAVRRSLRPICPCSHSHKVSLPYAQVGKKILDRWLVSRELAFQISEQFIVLGISLNIRTAVIVGGMDMMAQALELGNRPHIIIATPGRIVDHLRSSTNGEWDLSRVKFLVFGNAHSFVASRLT
jgi:ATP-dependent RNA helicase DDX49/DBP8